MRKVTGFAVAILMCSVPAAHAANADVNVRRVDTSHFPQVEITVSIEGSKTPGPEDVRVTEAGRPVEQLQVASLSESGRSIDVVLAIDTSGSMQGTAMASAVSAALRFATNLPENIGLGIVTFDDKPKTLLKITKDRSSALNALGALEASGETSMYDSVVRASDLFSGAGQHNIILLSDGGDTASKASFAAASAAARRVNATVFSVGLTTPDTDVKALRSLSEATKGRYAPAGTAKLTSIYEGLATEIGNQFLISYSSERTAGGQVNVAVNAFGASDSALVLTPKVTEPAPEVPAAEEAAEPELPSTLPINLTLGVFFAAVFVIGVMLFGVGARARKDRELARRVAASAKTAALDAPAPAERGSLAWMPEGFVRAGSALADVGGFGDRVDLKLERAGLPLRAGEFVAGSAAAAVAGALVGSVLFGGIVFAMLAAAAGAAVPAVIVGSAVRRRAKKLQSQLADVLMILASSLRAGHSFFQGLDMVAKEIGAPANEEFGRVVAEIRLGRPLEEAMNGLAERVGSEDFKWAVLAVEIQREVGGNLAEVLDTVAETVRERDGIRRQIDVLTAEGRLSIAILTALPILVALYISKVNPKYMNLLFSTRVGLIMLTVASSLLVLGIMWMRKVVKIDV